MPRINRIRVVNIFYDDDRKLLPDIVFEPYGLDSIILLANGGGKSLLIQLALQTVLPNEKMGGRSIKQLLKHHRYTGHVLVEWILDNQGDTNNYLCTGFCFTEDSRREFDYCNYLFEYSDTSKKYDIETLPLVNSDLFKDNVMSFYELKDWISNDQSVHFQLFHHQIKPYQSVLREYRILPEEWRNIRETNSSEGGVAKFFERGKTTSQLVENILIPGIEEMMFNDELKKKELITAFSKHRQLLLDIPIIKKNLKDFEVIREHAQQVVDAVQELDNVQAEVRGTELYLARLEKTFVQHKKTSEMELLRLDEELVEYANQEAELIWQERSYAAFLKELEYYQAELERVQAEQEYEQENLALERVTQQQQELLALDSYNQLLAATEEAIGYKNTLETMDKSEPELKVNLTQIRNKMRLAWDNLQSELATRSERKQLEIKGFEQKLTTFKAKIETARDEESEFSRQITEIDYWFRNFQTEQQSLRTKGVSEEALLEPDTYLESYKQDLEDISSNMQAHNIQIKNWEAEKDSIVDNLSVARVKKANLQNDLEHLRQNLIKYEETAKNLKEMLLGHECFARDLFADKDQVLLWIKDQVESIMSAKLRLEVEKADLEQKWLLLQDNQYYIPHQALLDIQAKLERANLFAITGSEWLAEQNLSPEAARTKLNNQPLLPYSIIIESSQVNAVKSLVKQMRNLTPDLPLLFLIKNPRNLSGESNEESFIPLFENDLYMFIPDSLNIYTSGEVFQNFKEQIKGNITALNDKLREYKSQESELDYLRGRIQSFYDDYQHDLVIHWKEEISTDQQLLAEIEEEIDQNLKNSEKLTENIKEYREKINQLIKASHKMDNLISMMEKYVGLFVLTEEKYTLKKKLTTECDQIKYQIRNYEEEMEEVRKKREDANSEANGIKQEIKQHHNEFILYRLEEADLISEIGLENLDYSSLKSKMETIRQQLSMRQGERDNIEKLLQKCENAIQIAKDRIERCSLVCSISEDWLKEHRREVLKDDLENAELAVENKKKVVVTKEAQFQKAQSNVHAKQAVWENVIQSVVKETGFKPYNEFNQHTHQQQYEAIQKKLRDLLSDKEKTQMCLKTTKSWIRENEDALEYLKNMDFHSELQKVVPFTKEEWDELALKPKESVFQQEKALRKKKVEMEDHKRIVDKQFTEYLRKLEKTQNAKVMGFIRSVQPLMENDQLYDYDYVETQFLRIFEALDQYQQQYEFNLQETQKNMDHLTDLCLRRAQTVYDNIIEIPKNSRVMLYDQDIQIIKLSWPTESDEENRQKIYLYLNQVLNDLNKWKDEGKDDDEIDRMMAEMLRTRNLIQVIAPIEDCLVTVFKPRKESLVRQLRNDRLPWDEVANWSGGEGYSIYITMFMTIINHIRQHTEGRQNVWKVIMADNPFGIASSSHILQVVFEVAKANQIQFICFTAHQDENILYSFPVVYSLQLRSAYGKEIMQAERLESGYYRVQR